jgi:hypothetical protein
MIKDIQKKAENSADNLRTDNLVNPQFNRLIMGGGGSIKAECPLRVKVYLKTHKIPPY